MREVTERKCGTITGRWLTFYTHVQIIRWIWRIFVNQFSEINIIYKHFTLFPGLSLIIRDCPLIVVFFTADTLTCLAVKTQVILLSKSGNTWQWASPYNTRSLKLKQLNSAVIHVKFTPVLFLFLFCYDKSKCLPMKRPASAVQQMSTFPHFNASFLYFYPVCLISIKESDLFVINLLGL